MAGTTTDKLQKLKDTKAAFYNAITSKGQSISNEPFSAWPAKVDAIETGITLPTLTSPGTAEDLRQGKQMISQDGNVVDGALVELDTSDATATAADMASGVTAYVDGEKVTGNIITYTSTGGNWPGNTFNELFVEWSGSWENQTTDTITVAAKANYDALLREGSGLHVRVPKSEFGDATTADVASGKIFTSAAGLKMTGTGSSGYGIKSYMVGDDSMDVHAKWTFNEASSSSTSMTIELTNIRFTTDGGSTYTYWSDREDIVGLAGALFFSGSCIADNTGIGVHYSSYTMPEAYSSEIVYNNCGYWGSKSKCGPIGTTNVIPDKANNKLTFTLKYATYDGGGSCPGFDTTDHFLYCECLTFYIRQ